MEGAVHTMGVPKRRVSHARQGERRSHLAISLPKLEECPHCHEMKQPHHACPNCGYYGGRQAIELKPAGGDETPA
jgi:large subunit ribosomal protein L32